MAPLLAPVCEVNEGFFSRFSKCKGEPVGVCQYCGRSFCREHGERYDDGQEICYRKNCLAKRDDLAVHLKYKEFVFRRNAENACGVPDCSVPPDGQCARCRAYFCVRHLDSREEILQEGHVRMARMTTMCFHCWQRRPIWTRT